MLEGTVFGTQTYLCDGPTSAHPDAPVVLRRVGGASSGDASAVSLASEPAPPADVATGRAGSWLAPGNAPPHFRLRYLAAGDGIVLRPVEDGRGWSLSVAESGRTVVRPADVLRTDGPWVLVATPPSHGPVPAPPCLAYAGDATVPALAWCLLEDAPYDAADVWASAEGAAGHAFELSVTLRADATSGPTPDAGWDLPVTLRVPGDPQETLLDGIVRLAPGSHTDGRPHTRPVTWLTAGGAATPRADWPRRTAGVAVVELGVGPSLPPRDWPSLAFLAWRFTWWRSP